MNICRKTGNKNLAVRMISMNAVNKYVFKIIVNSRLFDAYEAVVNTLEIYGIVISKDYRERTIVGKWNPVLHNEFGAKINVWTGVFRLWEDGSTTVVRLILSGNGDEASAKIMAKFFYKKLKKLIPVQNMYLDIKSNVSNSLTKELFTALRSAYGKPKRSFGQQLCDAIVFVDVLITEKRENKNKFSKDPWANDDDLTLYPDEDHEGHDHEPDGYCIEADVYIQDMM